MKNNITETCVALLLVILAILLLNPFYFWMPSMLVKFILVIALVLFGIFASFILREKSIDERDSQHRTLAGRNAFIAGSAVLLAGIVFQGYFHAIDPWLAIALVVMVLVKLGTRRWSDTNL